MLKKLSLYALGAFIFAAIIGLPVLASAPSKVNLTVPYIKEVPAGTSGGPWKNACEEASFTMLEKYYTGKKVMNLAEGKAFMTMFFNKENILYGNNVNSDTTQSKFLIDNYTDFNAKIIDNPTIMQIKSEIDAGRPVITPHYGFDLHNPNIPFLRTGTSYHMMVITGYDDATQQFIVNDPGDTVDGQGYRYGYDLFMGTLHDYSYKTKKADGPARAIFTFPKLVRAQGSAKIYYLHDNIRQYITNPTAFKNHSWKMEAVNVVSVARFNAFKEGAAINK
jgi:hypothetical protein